MKKNEKETKDKTKKKPQKTNTETVGSIAEKILDHALCLIDKRISFASENTEVLDDLSDYINSLDKEDMSKSEKNSLIQKISDLKLSKISEITSVISMCKDKLNTDCEENDDREMIFLIDYGDKISELSIKEDLNED